jgi:hypothetical protein
MKRAIMGSILVNCAGFLVFSQSPETPPRFDIADVQVSAKTINRRMRTGPVRGDRYEIKNATMVDLIGIAYGFDPDKVLGGPNWLEMDRFDVLAKVPADSTPETQKQMLQSLLEDRFKLVVHKDTRPLPTYALTVGKKLRLKEADGTGETGCKLQAPSGAPAEGGMRIMTNGVMTTVNLGQRAWSPGDRRTRVRHSVGIVSFPASHGAILVVFRSAQGDLNFAPSLILGLGRPVGQQVGMLQLGGNVLKDLSGLVRIFCPVSFPSSQAGDLLQAVHKLVAVAGLALRHGVQRDS